jgi:hypothetical protein
LARESIRGVKLNLEFFKEFYDFSTSINSFLGIRAIKDAFILAFIKYFLEIIRK